MEQYIQVAEDENDDAMELPCEEDSTLLLSTLVAQFPGACGLKYRNRESGGFRGLRIVEGKIYPPEGSWDSPMYIAVFPKENKRKGEDGLENPTAKTKRLDKNKCSDLIVLGLPWKSTDEDLRTYFSQFGELLMVQVKKDIKTGQSKGFGFIRFVDYDAQLKCLSQRHMIDGRWCDVRVPNSRQDGTQQIMNRKVFIGRCSEEMTADDLRSYFMKYGEVVDVFIPKPFRAFAFVTFADPEIAQNLCGEDHIIKNTSVHVSSAAPKNFDKSDKRGMGGYGGQGGGFGGYGGRDGSGKNGGWGNQGGSGGMGGGNQGGGPGNMGGNNPLGNMGLGNLGAAFQLNPAMVAAAQAALSQGPWGLLGMANQGANNPNMGGGGDNNMGKGNSGGYGNFGGSGGGNSGNRDGSGGGSSGFLGSSGQGNAGSWSNGPQGSEGMNSQSSGWGQSQQSGSWN